MPILRLIVFFILLSGGSINLPRVTGKKFSSVIIAITQLEAIIEKIYSFVNI